MRSDPAGLASILVSVVAAVVVVAIGWSSARGLDTLWDEQVDHDIAVGLLVHPLTGEQPTLDASQARLPMYVNAVAFAVTGRDDLAVSRGVSLAVAGLTVIASASLGRILFGPLAGALAAVFLALSPYFLAYARISMTEGDVFFACLVTLTIRAFVCYLRDTTPSSWTAAAVLLGLTLGAKIFAGFLFIVFGTLVVLGRSSRSPEISALPRDVRRLHRLLAASLIVLVSAGGAALLSSEAAAGGRNGTARHAQWAAIGGWAVLLVLWGATAVHVLVRRAIAPGRTARLLGMFILATITFFALMPVHLIEHDIARDIARRVLRWDNAVPLGLWREHLRLYAGILLIKATVPLGMLTAAALVFGVVRSRRDSRWRPGILGILTCVVCLCLLPLRQSFYMMGVYPLMMILAAAFAVAAGRRLRRSGRAAGAAWSILILLLLAHLGREAYIAYPHYHLYGYEIVGHGWLGAESRGYRNLIQTPSDGVESLIRWCNADPRVLPGDRVVSYLWEEEIIRKVLPPDAHYVFVPRGVGPRSGVLPPRPPIDDADFVLVHINNVLGYGDRPPDLPPDPDFRDRFVPVHTVRRGSLEVGWVYERRQAPP